MAEFHESRIGRIFLEGTAPRIAEALERIATAIEQQNELAKLALKLPETEEDPNGCIGDKTSL